MRDWLSKMFSSFPSDVMSFTAGAVFSAAVNLATAKADPQHLSWLPILLLFASTLGFIRVGYALKTAEEAASGRHEIRIAHVRNNFLWVCVFFFVALGTLIVGLAILL